MQETQLLSLGQEDPLEEEMATHSSVLAWGIPRTEEPGRLQSMGSQGVRQDWAHRHGAQSFSPVLLWDPMDCSLPGSSVHGNFQPRTLKWVAIFFSRGSSWPRGQTRVSCMSCSSRQILTTEPAGKAACKSNTWIWQKWHLFCRLSRVYWVGQKVQVFLWDVAGNLKQTFWPTQNVSLLRA